MNVKILFVTLIIALMIVACGSKDEKSDPVVLDGTGWTLVTLNGQAPLSGTTITAAFSEGEVTGQSGCNSYFGPYTLDGNALQFDMIGMTEMACLEPEGLMDQEMAYLGALQAVAEARLVDGQLEMLDDSGAVILRFKP